MEILIFVSMLVGVAGLRAGGLALLGPVEGARDAGVKAARPSLRALPAL